MSSQAVGNFWDRARARPGATVLIDERQREWSGRDLEQEANRIAHGLRALGLREGSVVACVLPSCATLVAVLLATNQVGMYLLTINPRFTAVEVEHLLADSGAALVLVDDAVLSDAVRSLVDTQRSWRCVSAPTAANPSCANRISYRQAFALQNTSRPPQRRGGAVLSYTSGTTGRPKGVLRPVAQATPELGLAPLVSWYTRAFDIDPQAPGVYLSCCPIFFSGPMMYLQYALHLGHTVVLLPTWNPRIALNFIQRFGVTHTLMVPFHFASLLSVPVATRTSYRTASLRCVVHGGAPCAADVKQRMLDWLGDIVHETYGATEVGATVALAREWRRFPGTVGRGTQPGGVRIYTGDAVRAKPFEVGRIYLKQSVADAFVYKGDEAKTRAARIGEYVTVGDVGYLNEEDYLFICDRSEDLILCRGENVYPAQVESALALMDGVADCACYGTPHETWGEEVTLAIRPTPGGAGQDLMARVRARLEERLSGARRPTRIHLVTELPRDESGKLRRHALRNHPPGATMEASAGNPAGDGDGLQALQMMLTNRC